MRKRYVLIFFALSYLFWNCEQDEFITNPSARLNFSVDTVQFDTVFTTIGSTTKRLMVYNNHNRPIQISSIHLAGAGNSNFRLNVNGLPGRLFNNIEIAGRDSMFIFVEVTVDPTNANSPLVIVDSIVFETNNNIQDVKLVAWGQDVHLIRDSIINTQTWTSEKPYLIYEAMLVDTGQVLTIEAGAKLYFHKNAVMYITGSLVVNGTKDEPVVFRGDRLDNLFSDLPYDKLAAQWGGLLFVPPSRDNVFNYAHIRNASSAIVIGTSEELDQVNIEFYNTIIENNAISGITAFNANIKAVNTVISNCGYTNLGVVGGSYEFYHCTFANYYPWGRQSHPLMAITNYSVNRDSLGAVIIEDGVPVLLGFDLEKFYVGNSIIYGTQANEIGWGGIDAVAFNYEFDHCLIRLDDVADAEVDTASFKNIILSKDPMFVSTERNEYDFQLDSLSTAIDKGSIEIGNLYPLDFNGNSRVTNAAPDLGAFESDW